MVDWIKYNEKGTKLSIVYYYQINSPLFFGLSSNQTGGAIPFPESCFQEGTASFSHSQSALEKVQILFGRTVFLGTEPEPPSATHAVQTKWQTVTYKAKLPPCSGLPPTSTGCLTFCWSRETWFVLAPNTTGSSGWLMAEDVYAVRQGLGI